MTQKNKFNDLFYYAKTVYLPNSGIMYMNIKMAKDVKLHGVFTSTVIPFDPTKVYGQIEFKKDEIFKSCFLSENSGSLLFNFNEMKIGRLVFPSWQPPQFILIKTYEHGVFKIAKSTNKTELIKIAIQEAKLDCKMYETNKKYLMTSVENFLNDNGSLLFKYSDYSVDIIPI